MTLADLLSQTQVQSMITGADKKNCAETYAPSIPAHIQSALYDFAGTLNCQLKACFWSNLDAAHTSAMVCIKGKQAQVLPVVESVIFARHLGELLKEGNNIVWVVNAKIVHITWENWREIYARLTGALKDDDLPMPISGREKRRIRTDRNRQRMFDEQADCIRYKKMGKRGFRMTFDEAKAEWRAEQYEKALRGVVGEARLILKDVL